MNKECLAALKKYHDPKHTAYQDRHHYKWITANFSKKDIEACNKELNDEIALQRIIDKHAKKVVRGYISTGAEYLPRPPPPPPPRPRARVTTAKPKVFYDARTNSYSYDADRILAEAMKTKAKFIADSDKMKDKLNRLEEDVRNYNARKSGKIPSKHDRLMQSFLNDIKGRK